MNMKKAFPLFLIILALTFGFKWDQKFDRKWEIFLIHHTHVDIGYTHTQDEVMEKQWRNLEKAMDLIDSTADMPEGARFKWNPETTWAIETWLEQADEIERERFVGKVSSVSTPCSATC
jgi:hypothetical protein